MSWEENFEKIYNKDLWRHYGTRPPGYPAKPVVPGRWIGVDLHGTLANHDGTKVEGDRLHIGEPIEPMVRRVRLWLEQGHEVRIMTAKIFPLWKFHAGNQHYAQFVCGAHDDLELQRESEQFAVAIDAWVRRVVGRSLVLTCVKDRYCREIWDDKAVPVEKDTGVLLYDGQREFT